MNRFYRWALLGALYAANIVAGQPMLEELLSQAEARVAAANFQGALATLEAMEAELKSSGARFTPEDRLAARKAGKGQAMPGPWLQQMRAAFVAHDWKGMAFALEAAKVGVFYSDRSAPPEVRYRNAKAIVEATPTIEARHTLAKRAYETGRHAEALEHAKAVIERLEAGAKRDFDRLRLSQAYTVEGAAYLALQDVAQAKKSLLRSGQVIPRSSSLIMEPNLFLAERLLDRLEFEAVRQYVAEWQKTRVWPPGAKRLVEWEAALASGRRPDFGGRGKELF